MLGTALVIILVLGILFIDKISTVVNKIKLPTEGKQQFIAFAGLLCTILLIMFGEVIFNPKMTMFSNDGPLGAISSDSANFYQSIGGVWKDLNWVGLADVSVRPDLSALLVIICGCPILIIPLVLIVIYVYRKI